MDLYYQLAKDYCSEHCHNREQNKQYQRKIGDCVNCQVEGFGEWLDNNVKQKKGTVTHIKSVKNLNL